MAYQIKNLLGYAPLIQSHNDIVRKRLGIVSTADDPNDDSVIINNPPPFVRGIPNIKDLAEYISGKLSAYKEIKTSPYVPANRTGSSTQIGYVEVLPSGILEDYPRNRNLTE